MGKMQFFLRMVFLLTFSMLSSLVSYSQSIMSAPRLMGPSSISCAENNVSALGEVLLDSFWTNDTNSGVNDYIQLMVNMSVRHGSLSFNELRNVKFLNPETNIGEGVSSYSLIGRPQFMDLTMKSIIYSTNSVLPAGSVDVINMTISQMTSKMG